MTLTFDPDPKIGDLFEAFSLDCIDLAQANLGMTLDVSEASIQKLEQMAGVMHTELPGVGAPPERIELFAKMVGSHIGHVLVTIKGAVPGLARSEAGVIPAVKLPDGTVCWPMPKAYNRLVNGEADNLWHYYLGISGQLDQLSARP